MGIFVVFAIVEGIMSTKTEVRNSVKIVLLNDKNELLLMGTDDQNIKNVNGEYKGRFWQLIGGKIEENETIMETAKRELFEETSINSKDVEFGPIILHGELNLLMNNIQTTINQKFIVARLKTNVNLSLKHLTKEEKRTVTELKWFSLKEIEDSKEIIYPGVLPIYLKQLLDGNIPDSSLKIDLAKMK